MFCNLIFDDKPTKEEGPVPCRSFVTSTRLVGPKDPVVLHPVTSPDVSDYLHWGVPLSCSFSVWLLTPKEDPTTYICLFDRGRRRDWRSQTKDVDRQVRPDSSTTHVSAGVYCPQERDSERGGTPRSVTGSYTEGKGPRWVSLRRRTRVSALHPSPEPPRKTMTLEDLIKLSQRR